MLTFFTPKEAEQLLDEVKKLLADIMAKRENAERKKKELDRCTKYGLQDEREQKKEEFSRAMCELDQGVKALEELGCILRDLEIGLVDFPAIRYGEQVYLCWRIGEREVSYWHSMTEGYAGRKPIKPEEKANGEKVFA